MKVLQLLPMFSIGGAEMLATSLAAAATTSHVCHHVCALFDRGQHALRPELEKSGVPIHCFNGARLYSPTLHVRMAQYIRKHHIDVIHTHLLPADIVGRIVGKALGVPVVSTLHSVPQGFSHVRSDRRWLERTTAVHWTGQLVTVAAHVREQFIKEWAIPPDKLHVIYNAIPMLRFLSIPEEPVRSEWKQQPIIMTIGRLTADKAQHVFIRAAKIVLEHHPEALFVLVGEGEEREALTGLIRSLDLDEKVLMTGMRRDVPELLAQCDIFVLSSRFEGLPLSAIEAMAAARPVVVTDVGGNRELVSNGVNGLVLPAGDSSAIASTIIALIENPEQRLKLARAGREHVRYQYDLHTMIQQYEALYERLVEPRH